MVGRRVLAPVMGVRALLPQPLTVDWPAPSSRGPGHGPLKAETRVRIPLGPPNFSLRFSAKTSHPRASGRGDVPLGVEIGRPPLPSSPVRCSRGIVSLDSSAGKLLRADADEAELAVPGILAVIEEGQE